MTLEVRKRTPEFRSWWRRWLLDPIIQQLTQGVSPQHLSWTVALGVVFGIFPIMGSTTVMCLLVGWIFKLNQAILHAFKAIVYPLHLSLILVFIRMGERLYGAPLIPFSVPQLMAKFKESPVQFAKDFGMTAWHGVSAWLLIAPFATILIKILVTPIITRMDRMVRNRMATHS
ncbi:DUF2062 domain-containing protein [Luteolibacter pohnpeiensis]|uniref:DUF2062 domain-containing protein n=1 Tax=Luteolibacter pohnpeiensis TaxID=454153 RepID=A0A934S4K1_9BACT|nr:DUF2062 domain-containing protein [Luteolibacter pohnpeiensis]MBK1882416.1 DUF2062 domain-containing protein [Luteolibacter pohnpeiensis]